MTEAAKPPSLIKSFIAGGVGGTCLVVTGHPLDTIKVLLQTQVIKAGEAPLYGGVADCAKKIVARDGFVGLYRGMMAPIIGVTPMYALCFFGYGIGQKIFCNEDSMKNLELGRIAAAGAISGLFTTPILAPGERLKCVMQVASTQREQGMNPKYTGGPKEVFSQMYKDGGIRSVGRGFWATMARDSLASAFYFSSYELLKAQLRNKETGKTGVLATLFAGGTAGVLNWAAALPIDSLKSRYQVAPEGTYPHGIRSVFREVMAKEGISSLYRGFGAVMLRAFPANAACFLGYETAIKVLTSLGMD